MRDLSKNENIKHLETITVPPIGNQPESKIELYKCKTRSGLWRVTTSTEYDDGYNCWFERLVMPHWNDRTKKIPTWEQIVDVKREFFKPTEECIHFIPRDDEYINLKENCMHIFHPLMEFDPKSIK